MSERFINVPEKMKFLRLQTDLSQRDLGLVAGLNQKTVSDMELGNKVPTLHILLGYSSYFGVTIDDLLFDEIEEFKRGEMELSEIYTG